jgi:hypothetical protein
MEKIALCGEIGKDKYILVDDKDFKKVNKIKWYLNKNGRVVKREKGKNLFPARLILNCPKGMFIDHINQNKLDNRRCNLRICTQHQNNFNIKKRGNATSKYKGVYWNKKTKLWQTGIMLNYKQIYIGSFTNERWGALAYDIWAKELHGEFASLNFHSL